MNPVPVLAGILVLAFGVLGTAKLAAVPAMRSKAEHVGFTVAAYRRIGALELLAAVGLLVGAALPFVGVLAAIGLLLLLAGAIITHLRSGDSARALAPALALAVVALTFVALVVGR
jgi:hypothetical protein